MSSPASNPNPDDQNGSFVADSLAIGVTVMLLMTVVQRGVGFMRGVWFCHALDDVVVGQWSMAYDFIITVTPVMLLGMPGSLPRYVEHYRINGQLRAFVRRLLVATTALGAIFYASMLIRPDWFGWLIFLQPESLSLVYSVGIGVLSIIVFNFIYELVAALRQVRVVSLMQFVQSISFTVIAIAWLSLGGSIIGVVYSFVLGTWLGMIPGLLVLTTGWGGLPRSETRFDASSMWRRVLPFALALWVMNLLTNIFCLSDRYMILHLMPGGELVGQAAVGQYHSGRMIPALLMSLSTMISAVLMPYLAADWEAGRKEAVKQQLKKILFGVSAIFTIGAAFALWFSPWFFAEFLENRYSDGLELMPMAFVFSIWVAIATVGQDYLWVAERGKLVAVAVGIGLLSNVTLNLLLLPVWGLHGAVVATMVSNGIFLGGLWVAMARHGFAFDRSAYYASIMPATLLAGPWVAAACVAITCLVHPQARTWITEGYEEHLAPRLVPIRTRTQ